MRYKIISKVLYTFTYLKSKNIALCLGGINKKHILFSISMISIFLMFNIQCTKLQQTL